MGSRYRLAYALLAALAVLVLAAEIALVVRGRDEDERVGMVLDAVGRQSCAADEHAAGRIVNGRREGLRRFWHR